MTYRSCCVQIKREIEITNQFGSFACWKARLTRTGSFQGTSTFLACSAGVLLGRVTDAKKLAIVHSTNQFSPMEKSKIAAIIFNKIILSTCPPKLRLLYRLVLSSPKPQLWDDHLVKKESWRNYRSLCGNIYDSSWEYKYSQILNKNASPYFHGVSLAIWPLTMLRTHFGELFISRFTTYIRKALGCTLYFRKLSTAGTAHTFFPPGL